MASYFQKAQYTLIDSIDELDPRKINIRDLNKKYMDRNGNRYGLRFNLESRNIEIVRLAGSKNEAAQIRAEVLRQRRPNQDLESALSIENNEPALPLRAGLSNNEPLETHSTIAPDFSPIEPPTRLPDLTLEEPGELFNENDSGFVDDFSPPSTVSIHEVDLFPELEREVSRITDSQKAILRIMNRSGYFGDADSEFAVTVKQVDEQCVQGAFEAARLYQEFTGYPKTPTHYLTDLPDSEKKKIEAMVGDELQLRAIKHFELNRRYSTLLQNILSLTTRLRKFLDELPESERHKKDFQDLIPSFAEITSKASTLRHQLQQWNKQTVDQF